MNPATIFREMGITYKECRCHPFDSKRKCEI